MLEKFTVIDILKTRSDSVATINGNCLKFNVQTCHELEYPPYIQVMMNAKDKQFAIRPCKEDDANAMSFSKPKAEQKYYVRVNFPAATALIRKATGWSSDETWNVPGVFIAEEHALIYDLGAAYKPASKHGGWNARKELQQKAAEAAEKISKSDDGEGKTE